MWVRVMWFSEKAIEIWTIKTLYYQKRIARCVGMLALQHLVHFVSVQPYYNWCAYYSVWGSFLTHGSYMFVWG